MTHSSDDARTAAIAALNIPAEKLKTMPADILERFAEVGEMHDAFFRDAMVTGTYDRARLRECLAAYGRVRADILSHLGLDVQSGEILPVPAQLLDS